MIREKKKGEKYFRFEFMEGGKRISGTLSGKKGLPFAESKQEARDRESEIRIKVRTQLRDGTFQREIGLEDFGTFFDKVFLPYAKEHKASWRHDEFRGKVLKEFFAGKTFGEITPMLLAQYVNVRLKAFSKHKALFDPTTIHKEVALTSSIFNMAIREGVAKSNPCHSIPTAIKKKLPARNKRDRFLTEDEETKLFAQFTGRRCHLFPIIRFVLDTGLRKREFCRLEVGDINLSNESRFVTVKGMRIEVKPDELIVKQSKNGKPRTIPLTSEARRIAKVQITDATTRKFLFTSRRTGGMISEFKTAFTSAVRDAGLENFRFHDLRHTFASRLNAAGADPYTIRDLLVHSTTAMSADYTHTSFERRRQAIADMSQSRDHLRGRVALDYGKIPEKRDRISA
ncbi:MAG TPA: site-specific integrase [Pyrinomonadaceae bacterium]|nr:site-specific integrase [Pyrinomonadaceae bacterium]